KVLGAFDDVLDVGTRSEAEHAARALLEEEAHHLEVDGPLPRRPSFDRPVDVREMSAEEARRDRLEERLRLRPEPRAVEDVRGAGRVPGEDVLRADRLDERREIERVAELVRERGVLDRDREVRLRAADLEEAAARALERGLRLRADLGAEPRRQFAIAARLL